ncbi:MAG TPA: class I SAM-dependent methyltransferase [Tepidisphaeraceae bacterium]|jgi:SAM-dependent methyltransferase|nr:class I SAM-dependent methyltransferase [Tepidisphaeraceae bacterium]
MKTYRAIAEYYDAESEHHAMLRQDVPFLLGHLPRRSQTIMELAVGTGRAAIPLAQAGHRVVGVDYARDMLAIARGKRDAAGISPRNLSLVRADVLRLKLRRKFDWVVLLFNTFLGFPTLKGQDALLQGVAAHLKRGGKFWLDIFQPNLALIATPRSKNLDPVLFHVPKLNRSVFRTTSVERDPAAQIQLVTFHYQWFDDRGREHRQKVAFTLTFVFPRELQLLLERNGLAIEKLYGNYDGSPLTADSPRMIALCRRR